MGEKDQDKILKVCAICGESFETKYPWKDTCPGCNYKPMYPNKEAADEALGH